MSANIATRDAYGKALVDLGRQNRDIVVLDADLSTSTKTALFAKEFPDRFFNMGIAEQNLMGTAAGLAASGKIPFASTFAIFATGRAFEPIRNAIAYPKLNVKIAATHAGLTVGEDGASHQCLEDIAVMRAVPNMTIMCPADGVETEAVVRRRQPIKAGIYKAGAGKGPDGIFRRELQLRMGQRHHPKGGQRRYHYCHRDYGVHGAGSGGGPYVGRHFRKGD